MWRSEGTARKTGEGIQLRERLPISLLSVPSIYLYNSAGSVPALPHELYFLAFRFTACPRSKADDWPVYAEAGKSRYIGNTTDMNPRQKTIGGVV